MTDEEFVRVVDHEEWAAIAAGSESGAYKVEGFMVGGQHGVPPEEEPEVVERAVEALARRDGWYQELVSVVGQFSVAGMVGWWVSVPVDYTDELDDPEAMTFDVVLGDRAVSLWAYERYVKAAEPDASTPEFAIVLETCLTGGTKYVYQEER